MRCCIHPMLVSQYLRSSAWALQNVRHGGGTAPVRFPSADAVVWIQQRRKKRQTQTACFSATTTSSNNKHDPNSNIIVLDDLIKSMCSQGGLDPRTSRYHAPLVYHPEYSFADWPETHTFPMDKFARLAHALTHTSLLKPDDGGGIVTAERPLVQQTSDFFRPLEFEDVPREWLCGPIATDFVERFMKGQLTEEECRRIGFCEQTARPELVRRTVLEVAGTVLAAHLALGWGIAAHLAGGTHHAHPTGGAGYTILNDLAVAAHVLTTTTTSQGATTGVVERVLVIDTDVHQGDGTAQFSNDVLKDRLFTLSLHCASNYPHDKAQSNMDVGLPDKMGDDDYMTVLEDSVDRAIREVEPDIVLYDAGVDVYKDDRLGRLKLTENGIRRRDQWVLERCVTAGIPVAAVIGGGYDKDVDALARRHAIVHEEASRVWRRHKMWYR